MTYSTLIFDLDGTISDSSTGIARSINYALQHFGVPALDEAGRSTDPDLPVSFFELIYPDYHAEEDAHLPQGEHIAQLAEVQSEDDQRVPQHIGDGDPEHCPLEFSELVADLGILKNGQG